MPCQETDVLKATQRRTRRRRRKWRRKRRRRRATNRQAEGKDRPDRFDKDAP